MCDTLFCRRRDERDARAYHEWLGDGHDLPDLAQLLKRLEHQISGFYTRSTAAAMDINQAVDDASRAAALAAARDVWQECKCPPTGLPELVAGESFRVLEGGITLLAPSCQVVPFDRPLGSVTAVAAARSGLGGGAQVGAPSGAPTQRSAAVAAGPGSGRADVPLARIVEQVGLPADYACAFYSALADEASADATLTAPALETAARAARLRIGDRLRLLQAAREYWRG